jgi:hypothetical protein
VAEIPISDRGLAVFAFAIYHQLESGSRVTQVVREDGAGHHADPAAIQELQRLGLVHADTIGLHLRIKVRPFSTGPWLKCVGRQRNHSRLRVGLPSASTSHRETKPIRSGYT